MLCSRQNNRSIQVFMSYSIGIFDQKSSNKPAQLQRQARKVFLRATSFTIVVYRAWITKALTRLRGCTDWSVPLLFSWKICIFYSTGQMHFFSKLASVDFYFSNCFEKLFKENHQSIKQFGCRSGLAFSGPDLGLSCFKDTRMQQSQNFSWQDPWLDTFFIIFVGYFRPRKYLIFCRNISASKLIGGGIPPDHTEKQSFN